MKMSGARMWWQQSTFGHQDGNQKFNHLPPYQITVISIHKPLHDIDSHCSFAYGCEKQVDVNND